MVRLIQFLSYQQRSRKLPRVRIYILSYYLSKLLTFLVTNMFTSTSASTEDLELCESPAIVQCSAGYWDATLLQAVCSCQQSYSSLDILSFKTLKSPSYNKTTMYGECRFLAFSIIHRVSSYYIRSFFTSKQNEYLQYLRYSCFFHYIHFT